MSSKNRILVIVGPTGSGKTQVAYELSKHLPVEMISCDSMQVYKGMPIITQAPTGKLTRVLKTHLVSFLSLSCQYNAALFRNEAQTLIQKILKKKKIPMIVGGTGLYLRALLDGLFESEPGGVLRDEKYRKTLLSEHERRGGDYLHEKLAQADPSSARKIHPNDIRRIVRALEVCHLTQRPFSSQRSNRKGLRDEFDFLIVFLDRERGELYARINQRVDRMIKQGLLAEARKTLRKRLSLTAQGALGLKEMRNHIDKKSSFEEAVELLKKNTRNYAKRQLSWFRHERGVKTLFIPSGENPDKTALRILSLWGLVANDT